MIFHKKWLFSEPLRCTHGFHTCFARARVALVAALVFGEKPGASEKPIQKAP